jgi:eukaryotic-like serine/threonine-protein kinase
MSALPAAAETIGNYMIERSLAQGSMGHVYVARHQLTYARVALKVLRSEVADATSEERFLREVRAAAQIGHEGIVKVLDAGRDLHGRLYLAMELLTGETFEERMTREPAERVALMHWIAHALPPLVAAHAAGIIHRDLKPANLFIALHPDGTESLKLLDFGLARDTRQKSKTETGIALGTPYYMSPEQAMRPKEVGPATDVWALGVMMYEVLSGHMPFDGETLHAVVLQSSTRPHVPLVTRRPELDPALCELVEDCLCKDPEQRPHDASALLARLLPLLEDPHVSHQLQQPISITRVSADHHAHSTRPQQQHPQHVSSARPGSGRPASGRAGADNISYADTAITMPAPRIDETERSYAPRRASGPGVLVPMLLSLALLGGGVIGYLRFAPTAHLKDEQPAEVQHQAEVKQLPAPTTPPTAAAVQTPTQAPSQPIMAAAEPVQQPSAAETPKRPATGKAASKKSSRKRAPELPLPDYSTDLPQDPQAAADPAAPAPEAPVEPEAAAEPPPSAPAETNVAAPEASSAEAQAHDWDKANNWDKVDSQLPVQPQAQPPSAPQLDPQAPPEPF